MEEAAKMHYKLCDYKEQNNSGYFWKPSNIPSIRFLVKEGNAQCEATNPQENLWVDILSLHFYKSMSYIFTKLSFYYTKNKWLGNYLPKDMPSLFLELSSTM